MNIMLSILTTLSCPTDSRFVNLIQLNMCVVTSPLLYKPGALRQLIKRSSGCSRVLLWLRRGVRGVTLPALSSTLWAVGCQLRMPTRLECPSSLTTGSVRGEVSPPSGISQIYLAWKQIGFRVHTHIRVQHDVQSVVSCFRENVKDCCITVAPIYHDAAVLRATGNDVVVVRTELDVQDRPRVAAHGRVGHVDASGLQRQKRREG